MPGGNKRGLLPWMGARESRGTLVRGASLKTCAALAGLCLVSGNSGGLVWRAGAVGACRPLLET
jgi:hypothetical protein